MSEEEQPDMGQEVKSSQETSEHEETEAELCERLGVRPGEFSPDELITLRDRPNLFTPESLRACNLTREINIFKEFNSRLEQIISTLNEELRRSAAEIQQYPEHKAWWLTKLSYSANDALAMAQLGFQLPENHWPTHMYQTEEHRQQISELAEKRSLLQSTVARMAIEALQAITEDQIPPDWKDSLAGFKDAIKPQSRPPIKIRPL